MPERDGHIRGDDACLDDLRLESAALPPTDATGDVDLGLIDYSLGLTPAERLTRLEEFAEFILAARRANGILAWSDSENS